MKFKKILGILLKIKKIVMKINKVKNYYNSNEACKITELTYKQLDYYDRTNFINPSINQADGYGTKRLYSFNDLLKLKVISTFLCSFFIKLWETRLPGFFLRRKWLALPKLTNNS